MEFLQNVPLAPYTTLHIGGPARYFAEAKTEEDIVEAVSFAADTQMPLLVLGGGSNVLVSDQGFPGLVLHIALRGVEREIRDGREVFSVAAGEEWDAFVAMTVLEECAGLECLSGIPGTVGGTPIQNVGAYGQEVSQTIASVTVFDRLTLAFAQFTNPHCEFSYRSSVFNTRERDRYVVTRVEYALVKNGAPTLTYKDLRLYFPDCSPTLEEVRIAVRSIRAAKGMLLVEGNDDALSAGSFFKNPVVPLTVIERIADALGTGRENIPQYPYRDTKVKIPAAWLLEQAGFSKGASFGRVGISSRHSLALVNRGGASAAEIVALRDRIINTVHRRFGIRLEPEPVMVG
jgi:UDP-N-acetylmuramate dehydrogenase